MEGAPSAHGANILAYLALIAWFPFALFIFSTLRPQLATMIVVVGGILVLPEVLKFDFPLIPPLDKNAIAALSGFAGIILKQRRQFMRSRPGKGIGSLAYLVLASAAVTSMLNRDVIVIGETVLPAMGPGEIIPWVIRDFLEMSAPFLLGRAVFRSSRDLRELMHLLCVFGLIYSLLAIAEMRLSPQLHTWLYGYHQHSFAQSMRWGGYRPTVFMEHGLAVAMFMLVAAMAVCVYSRYKSVLAGMPAKLLGLYMSITFVFCKSAGAVVYGLFAIPLASFASAKTQMRVATALAIAVAAYPIMKVSGTFPEETLVNIALDFSADRADSLQDRFDNDTMLAERARQRLWFGWGAYGRSRVYNDAGKDISVTDGFWVIHLGGRGAIGLGCLFGMLILPVFVVRKNLKKIPDKKDRLLLATFTLMNILFVVDLLPNGLYHLLPFFFAGAILGLAENLVKPHAVRARMPRMVPVPMPMPAEKMSRA